MQRAGRRTLRLATASRLATAVALAGLTASCRPPQGPPGAAARSPSSSLSSSLSSSSPGQARTGGEAARAVPDGEGPAAPGAEPAALPQAHEYRFDGLKLGDLYATAAHARPPHARPPYDRPCDDEAVDHKTRRAVVYGARPCRGSAFPEGTSVVFFLPYVSEHQEDWLRQPILAFGFLGGTYFHHRTSFPLRVGDPAARTRILGPVEATVSFPGYETTLRAERHPGDVYVLLDGDKVVGGLLGVMPAEPESEQWDVLLQMYERYTKPR